MTLTRSFIRNAAMTPLDARLFNMAELVCNNDGSPRVGVLGLANASIVATTATMNVTVAAAEFATSKGKADGVSVFTNDGTVNVLIGAAPASNSRIDVIWVKHNDDTTGDANALPVFGVTAGVAAAAPTKPAIPTGALELATLRIYSGTTATNGGANTLTNTYQMTASRGGVVPVRTKVELDLWTTATIGQDAVVAATGERYIWGGSMWLLASGDIAHLVSVAAQSIGTNGSNKDVTFAGATPIVKGGALSVVAANGIVTVAVAGLYRVDGILTYDAGGSAVARYIMIDLNGASVQRGLSISNGIVTIQAYALLQLSAGDTIRLRAYQSSGSALNIGNVSAAPTSLTVQRVGV